MAKSRKVIDETGIAVSTKRGFRTTNHCVAIYEETKRGLSCSYPTRKTELDGIHTIPLKN